MSQSEVNSLYSHQSVSFIRLLVLSLGYFLYFFAHVSFLFFLPILILLSIKKDLPHKILNAFYANFLKAFTRVILPKLQFYTIIEQSGFENIPNDKPVILIANHRSQFDGPWVLSIVKNCGVLIKASYVKNPLFLSFDKYFDFIRVDSSSYETLASTVKRCQDLLSKGSKLLIFPEGSRSPSSKVQVFKELAFKLSMEHKCPIIPLIVHSDIPFLAKVPKSMFPYKKMKVILRVLNPIDPEKFNDPSEFSDYARKIISDEVANLDKGTAWEMIK